MKQHRLRRVQLVNWGTFSGYWQFNVPRSGLLLTGPSGAGKSSVLDALSAILVQPLRLRFNAAAQGTETGDRDRNVVTYVRGAYKRQTDQATGEVGTAFLRKGPTWSGIALTFADESGQPTTLLRLLHLKGSSADPKDLSGMYLMAQQDVDLLSMRSFAENGIELRRVKAAFPDWDCFGAGSYSGFANKFRRRLGLESEQAQTLLHKTQSAKNLTSLDALFRDFMLDEPTTFKLSDDMVAQFDELATAHATVVDARRQVQALTPLRQLDADLAAINTEVAALGEQAEHLEQWLLTEQLQQTAAQAERTNELVAEFSGELERAQRAVADADQARVQAQRAFDGSGGAQLGTLEALAISLQERLGQLRGRLAELGAVAGTIGLQLPTDSTEAAGFADRLSAVDAELTSEKTRQGELLYAAFERRSQAQASKAGLTDSIEALRRYQSNLDPRLLEVRESLAERLQIAATALPFVGELLQVREDERDWTGPIERVLASFARTLVIPERHYLAAAELIDRQFLGARLSYERVGQQAVFDDARSGPQSLVHKLEIAEGAFSDWLAHRLHTRFDYACVGSADQFAHHVRAVTIKGQVKHSAARHEKDDRRQIDDRSRWVLGFSTQTKEAELQRQLVETAAQLDTATEALTELQDRGDQLRRREDAVRELAQYSWTQFDPDPLERELAGVHEQIANVRNSAAELTELETALAHAKAAYHRADQHRIQLAADLERATREASRLSDRLAELRSAIQAGAPVPDGVAAGLAAARDQTAETDDWQGDLRLALTRRIGDVQTRRSRLENQIGRQLGLYQRGWPAQAADWGDDVHYLPEYLRRLDDLITDRLPDFETRFFDLLQNQALRNISQLAAEIKGARRDIRLRVDEVNRSLRMTEFSPGACLQIEVRDRSLAEVDEFLATLNQITSGSLADLGGAGSAEERALAEERFERMRTLLDRLGSSDAADRSWRDRCLDTRRHVQFQARVQDAAGNQLDVFTGSGGRSGGERQKLVTFCLAAALRFQLAPAGQAVPSYALVVIDEAFDKADHHFTKAGLEVFTSFGFQLFLATPLKMLQTIEEYVGGVVMVANPTGEGSELQELIFAADSPMAGPAAGVAQESLL